MNKKTNSALDSRRWQRAKAERENPASLLDVADQASSAHRLLGRMDVLIPACALGWPRCTYGRVVLEGKQAWEAASMPYFCDRRELWDQLAAYARAAGRR